MPLFKRRSNETKSSDGPEEWARIAREKDAEIKRQRAAEAMGGTTVDSVHREEAQTAEQHEAPKPFTDVAELSEGYLRLLYRFGARRGKYVSFGGKIYVSPAQMSTIQSNLLDHSQILKEAIQLPGVPGAEVLANVANPAVGSDGLTDAGKFDIYFVRPDKPREDGIEGRFRVFGFSGNLGIADKKSRSETVEIAQHTLGPHISVEYASDMDLS